MDPTEKVHSGQFEAQLPNCGSRPYERGLLELALEPSKVHQSRVGVSASHWIGIGTGSVSLQADAPWAFPASASLHFPHCMVLRAMLKRPNREGGKICILYTP